jgi:hypothetical protein
MQKSSDNFHLRFIEQIERKGCTVGRVREEKSYFESKVFLVDNFWGKK